MDEGDTKGTFGKPPRNWNGISRFVEHSDVAKGSLTGYTVPVLLWFSKGAFSISLVHLIEKKMNKNSENIKRNTVIIIIIP